MQIKEMISLECIFFAFLITLCTATPPSLLKATWQEKSATIMGGEQRYSIYELDFDQPLYYQENWPCPCVMNRSQCNGSNSITPVNESGYLIQSLSYDAYQYQSTNFTDLVHFKFNLSPNQTNCQILVIELQAIYGQMQLLVSRTKIPTLNNYQWYKYQLQRDSLWICPTHPDFGYGAWYITVQNAAPVTLRNAFRIKWYTLSESITCPTSLISNSVSLTPDAVLLEDSREHEVVLDLLKYQYYVYSPRTVCTDFAISARQINSQQEGDVDLYVSLSDPKTSFETGYDWAAYINHDDALSLRTICSKSGLLSDFFIYSSVQTWKGDRVLTSVVATESLTFISRPVSQLPPQALFNSLAGATFEMHCPTDDKEEEILFCQFPAHIYCMEPQAPYKCCSPLMAIPATESANPLWPSLRALKDLEFSRQLPWDLELEPKANNSYNTLPNRLTLAVLRDIRYPNEYRKFVQTDNVSGCYLTWKHNFANKEGEAIIKSVQFKEKKQECNYNNFLRKYNEIRSLIKRMEVTIDYNEIRMLHLQVQMLMINDDIIYCEKYISKLHDVINVTLNYDNQPQCYHRQGTTEYESDPCCTYMPTLHNCCIGKNITVMRSQPQSLLGSSAQSALDTCRERECSAATLNNYIYSVQEINDRNQGCTVDWSKKAGNEVISSITSFIPYCRQLLLGKYNNKYFSGIECKINSDCQYGASCSTRGKCLHNDSHVVRCWIENMSNELQQSLFIFWGYRDKVTDNKLFDAIINRTITPACTGPGSLYYRDHWFWDTMAADCTDACSEQNLAPLCFETDPTYCPIPPECPEASSASCFHWWTYVGADNRIDECATELACNWHNDTIFNISTSCTVNDLSADKCANSCRVGEPVCLLCDGGNDCREINFNMTYCNLGLCSLNSTIHNKGTCEQMGSCSIQCGNKTCNSQTECENNGVCEGKVNISGCFSPFEPDFYGTPYCNGLIPNTAEVPYGCHQNNITTKETCESLSNSWGSFIWIGDSKFITDNITCERISNKQCYNYQYGIWVKMNSLDCEQCGLSYSKPLNWKQGLWTPGVMIPLIWTNRTVQPIRKVVPTLNYIKFSQEITQALIQKVALAYSTEAVCRSVPILDSISSLVCDCNGDSSVNEKCYEAKPSTEVGVLRACPHIATEIVLGPTRLNVSAESILIEDGRCGLIYINQTYASTYEQVLVPRLSSDLFITRSPNLFAVVKNSNLESIGQIVSDGITIYWDQSITINSSLQLCIEINERIAIDNNFDELVFATIIPPNLIIYQTIALLYSDFNKKLYQCANISTPGTYFAARILTETSPLFKFTRISQITGYIAATLYALLALIAIGQIIRVVRGRTEYNKALFVKIATLVMAIIFLSLRSIHMSNFDSSWFRENSILALLIVEVATVLFYVIYTSILYLWLIVILAVIKFNKRFDSTNAFNWYLISNSIVIISFVVLIVAYYLVPGVNVPPCKAKEIIVNGNNKYIANIAYLIFMSILSIITTIAYLFMGSWFIRELNYRGTASIIKRKYLVIMTIVILITFSALFIIRSVVVLWSAATSALIPLWSYAILELLPLITTLYYISPPHQTKTVLTSSMSSSNTSNKKKNSSSDKSKISISTTLTASSSNTDNVIKSK